MCIRYLTYCEIKNYIQALGSLKFKDGFQRSFRGKSVYAVAFVWLRNRCIATKSIGVYKRDKASVVENR